MKQTIKKLFKVKLKLRILFTRLNFLLFALFTPVQIWKFFPIKVYFKFDLISAKLRKYSHNAFARFVSVIERQFVISKASVYLYVRSVCMKFCMCIYVNQKMWPELHNHYLMYLLSKYWHSCNVAVSITKALFSIVWTANCMWIQQCR